MRIEKGDFNYKDTRYSVHYAVVGEKKYYFKSINDDKKLLNGNRIVSLELLDVIDSDISSCNFGIINSDGVEIIECNNKNIFQINDFLLFIEPSSVKSDFILKNIESKNNPELLKNIVNYNNKIISLLKEKVGEDGKIIFADPYSEITVIDTDGNNLVENKYYSYVALSSDFIYFISFDKPEEINGFAIKYTDSKKDINENVNNVLDDSIGSVEDELRAKIKEFEEKCDVQTKLIGEYSEKIVQLTAKIQNLEEKLSNPVAKIVKVLDVDDKH